MRIVARGCDPTGTSPSASAFPSGRCVAFGNSLRVTAWNRARSQNAIRCGHAQKIDGQVEARLVTLCCSTPPEGHQQWTLQLLVDELGRLKVVASVCRETVRKTLKKIASSRGALNASASQKPIGPTSLPRGSESSTFTTKSTTKRSR